MLRTRWALVIGLLLAASPAAAQVTVSGRVVEAGTSTGIPLAQMELQGHGAILAREDGTFSFEGVKPGGYRLWVAAFGYAAVSIFVRVDEDVTVTVPLDPAPIQLDALVATRIELKGHVRDRKNEISLIDAEILTNEGSATETDSHGAFKMKGVLQGFPLNIRVQAFGYVTLDTILSPERGEDYRFELEPDTAVEALIAVETAHMQEAVDGFFAVGFRNMNRDRLLKYAGAHTMRTLVDFEGGIFARRIKDVILDDERQYITGSPLTELNFILPESLERAEFVYCGPGCVIMRMYTREYMRNLLAHGDMPGECTITAGAPVGLQSGLAFDPTSGAALSRGVMTSDPIVHC